MIDTFEKKVRAAAVAAWWVVLIVLAFVLWIWFGYLFLVPAEPSWLLTLWGQGVDWPFVRIVWFWAIAGVKFFLWLITFVALWLTLWARQLRKHP